MDFVYNGTTACAECGASLNPVETVFGATLCVRCKKAADDRHLKNRMV